jgi:Bifunctional DNA primase/polymerase, N-terminal
MYQPWWLNDTYDQADPIPVHFHAESGVEGPALVRVWDDGKTDAGWGLTDKKGQPTFIPLYHRKKFQAAPILFGYEQDKWAFAFVMRSMRVVCIDIDGKNGGFDHAASLGMLPPTLAETSRSGEGYHLFYKVSEDEWDPDAGFAEFGDRIGIEQGVDFRGTGCVFHYQSQRWNTRHLAELPLRIKDRLLAHQQRKAASAANITKVLELEDPEEVLIMQADLLNDLKKPIPAGRRNNTLFAIGQQLKLAQIPDWEKHLHARALQVGLDRTEADKLVANIQRYN